MKRRVINLYRKIINLRLVQRQEISDFKLHAYSSYAEYKSIQIFHNKRKIENIWADKRTLDRVISEFDFNQNSQILGLCHGARNGFEQRYFNSYSANVNCIGTDISETATNYENSLCWDFHEPRLEWNNHFDFVYSNSLDHSYDPSLALATWLNQVKKGGKVVIELTEHHSPKSQSEMDPFGVRPQYFPFLLASWFGDQINLKISVDRKSNMNVDAFLFFISKNVDLVEKVS